MESKLQELTDKIYKESIEKARIEADALREKAELDAKKIIDEATQQATKIISDAEQKAAEKIRKAESEVKLASTQAIGEVKSAMASLITTKAIDVPIADTFANIEYVSQILTIVVEGFVAKGASDLKIIVPADKLTELEERVKKSLSATLSQGVKFEAGAVKSGFAIDPANGAYFVSFSDEAFSNLFKSYLRGQVGELLFGK